MGDVLAELGLELNDGPREFDLGEGVMVSMRPPQSLDWSTARRRAMEAVLAKDAFAAAVRRYDLTGADLADLFDPDKWDEVERFFVHVELATLVVSRVWRTHEGQTVEVEPVIAAFRVLFKRAGMLDRFEAEAETAGREIIRPKKGCAPSRNSSSRAGANTAGGAEKSASAQTGGTAKPTVRKASTGRASPPKSKPGA